MHLAAYFTSLLVSVFVAENSCSHKLGVFVPSSRQVATEVLKKLGVGPQDVFVELGSGNGVVCVQAAQLGASAIGFEYEPFLVERARKAIAEAKLEDRAKVVEKNALEVDLLALNTTVMYLWLAPNGLEMLAPQLVKALKHGVRMASVNFRFPIVDTVTWESLAQIDQSPYKNFQDVWLYKWGTTGVVETRFWVDTSPDREEVIQNLLKRGEGKFTVTQIKEAVDKTNGHGGHAWALLQRRQEL